MRILCLFVTLLVFTALPVSATPAVSRSEVTLVRVVDGDTLKVRSGRYEDRIRLIGIDAPEKAANEKAFRDIARSHSDLKTITTQGKTAWDHLSSFLKPGQRLLLEYDVERFDRFHRTLAYAYLPDGTMVNERMAKEGYAKPLTIPPNVRYASKILAAYQDARSNHRGLWAEAK